MQDTMLYSVHTLTLSRRDAAGVTQQETTARLTILADISRRLIAGISAPFAGTGRCGSGAAESRQCVGAHAASPEAKPPALRLR